MKIINLVILFIYNWNIKRGWDKGRPDIEYARMTVTMIISLYLLFGYSILSNYLELPPFLKNFNRLYALLFMAPIYIFVAIFGIKKEELFKGEFSEKDILNSKFLTRISILGVIFLMVLGFYTK
jgi:hypothetical protein